MPLSHYQAFELFRDYCGPNLRLTAARCQRLVVLGEDGQFSRPLPVLVECLRDLRCRSDERLANLPSEITSANAWKGDCERSRTSESARELGEVREVLRELYAEQLQLSRLTSFLRAKAETRSFLNGVLNIAKQSVVLLVVEDDFETKFFQERLHFASKGAFEEVPRTSKAEVMACYKEVCQMARVNPVSSRALHDKLLSWTRDNGIVIGEWRTAHTKYWTGISHVGAESNTDDGRPEVDDSSDGKVDLD